MKTTHCTVSLFLVFVATAATLFAGNTTASPKGGRWLETEPARAEFFVNPDRKVEINFYDAALQPVAPSQQVVAATAEPTSGRMKLEFDPTPTGYLSKTVLPAGEPYRVVVQVRAAPDAKPQNFRIDLKLETCAECQHAEYACTCEEH